MKSDSHVQQKKKHKNILFCCIDSGFLSMSKKNINLLFSFSSSTTVRFALMIPEIKVTAFMQIILICFL